MAAAERGALLGCLFLIVIRTATPVEDLAGRPETRPDTGSASDEDPFANCGDVPRIPGTGAYHLPLSEYCCPEAESGPFGTVYWPLTRVNRWTEVACPYGPSHTIGEHHGVAKANRRCVFSKTLGPAWRPSDYSACRTQQGTSESEAAEAADSAEKMTSDPSKVDSAAFQEASRLIYEAHELAKTNRTVAASMLRAVSNLVATPAAVQEEGDEDGSRRRALFQLMEDHGRGVHLDDDETLYEHRLGNLHMSVHKVRFREDGEPDLPADLQFDADYGGERGDVTVQLTPEVVKKAVASSNSTRGEEVRVRFLALRNSQLLMPPGRLSHTQQVVTVAVCHGPQAETTASDLVVSQLQHPVTIRMPMSANSMGTTHICAYFDEIGEVWRVDNLRTSMDGLNIVCETTHLTPFTLLLDPYPRHALAEMEVPMTIVGSIGSGLSILGLSLTVITYKFFSRITIAKMSIRRAAPNKQAAPAWFSQDRWGRVLVQLCLSLLFLHVFYLATNLKGALWPPACVAVAALLHASLLASFCWMLVEGLLLYQILVTVFKTADTKFMLKRLVFGWGAPVLVVVINFAACPNYYLDTHPDYCLVSGSNSLQHALTTIAPCCIIMVANLAIFLRVCLVLLRQRQMPGVRRDSDDRPRVTWAQIRGVVGVAFLLGVTWPLSPLGANQNFLSIISSGLNAFQGVAIFVSRVLTHPEARRCWSQRLFTSSPDFGSSASYSVNEKGSSWFRLRWRLKKDIASDPQDRRSIFKGAKPWSRGDSSNTISSSSGVVLSKSTSDTDILY